MKKLLAIFSLLLVFVLSFNVYAATSDTDNQTTTSTPAASNMQDMSGMMQKMQTMKMSIMGMKMMRMGMRMKMMSDVLAKSDDSDMKAKAEQMASLGEQLFSMGQSMGGDKMMSVIMQRMQQYGCPAMKSGMMMKMGQ